MNNLVYVVFIEPEDPGPSLTAQKAYLTLFYRIDT